MNPSELLDQYLNENFRLQLATVHDGRPWICTVYYLADSERNLYWASLPSRQHSQDIDTNPRVAAAILVRGVIGEPVIGIQAEGAAKKLEPSMYPPSIVEKYATKFKRGSDWVRDFIAGKTEHRLYELTPSALYLFDEEHFPGGQRQKIL